VPAVDAVSQAAASHGRAVADAGAEPDPELGVPFSVAESGYRVAEPDAALAHSP
jgi:hypothetical protein